MSVGQTQYRRAPSLIWPLVLITLGVLFLLQNLGYLPWAFWSVAWRFWPVILILVGIQLFFGRRPWVAAGLVVVVLVLSVLAALWLSYGPSTLFEPGLAATQQTVAEDLNDLQRACVEVEIGAGRLDLGSLPGDSEQLAVARSNSDDERARITKSMRRRNGEATLRLESRGDWIILGGPAPVWQVKLSPIIPMDLDVKTGAGESEMNLTELHVQRLTAETGVGRSTIRLPAEAGQAQATIQAGVGELVVVVPQGVEARIRVHGGLSSTVVDESRFHRAGDYYVSPGYDSAENRVDLRIQAGVGSIRVQ